MDYTIVEQVFVLNFTVRAYRGIKLISDFRSNVVFKMQFEGGFRLFDFFNILIVGYRLIICLIIIVVPLIHVSNKDIMIKSELYLSKYNFCLY